MNCMTHTEIPATAYCRICGKALCDACQRSAQGTVYCAEHLPVGVLVQSQPAAGPPPLGAGFSRELVGHGCLLIDPGGGTVPGGRLPDRQWAGSLGSLWMNRVRS